MKCPVCKSEINLKELRLRTTPENRYYWGVIVKLISDELGYTPEETHEILKHKFLKEIIKLKIRSGIELAEITKSTTSLTTIDFETYLRQIREWASIDMGLWLPLPNELEGGCSPSENPHPCGDWSPSPLSKKETK
jgi:hypothetical protein